MSAKRRDVGDKPQLSEKRILQTASGGSRSKCIVTFRHLYFSPDLRGARARDDAMEALRKLAGKPEQSPELRGLSDPFMFQDFYAERSPDQVANIFGTSFRTA